MRVPPSSTPPVVVMVSVTALMTAVPFAVTPRLPKSMSESLVRVSGFMSAAWPAGFTGDATGAACAAAGASSASGRAAARKRRTAPNMPGGVEG
jgi:hypothetical protein